MSNVLNWKFFLVCSLIFAVVTILAAQKQVGRDPKNVDDQYKIMKQMGETAGY